MMRPDKGSASAASPLLWRSAPAAAPLLWRDGFINWRGQLVRPSWQIVDGNDGSKFVIDTAHLDRNRHYVAAYLVGDDVFDPRNLFEFHFNCTDVAEVLANMDLVHAELIEKQTKELACGKSDQAE